MGSKTRIIILQMKEIIYTIVFVVLALLMIFLFIYMFFNLVDCFRYRPVAPLLLQSLQTREDAIGQQALLTLHLLNFFILSILFQIPTVHCKNDRKNGRNCGKQTCGRNNHMSVYVHWILPHFMIFPTK